MALQPGVVSLTIEYAQGIKDRDWIMRQSPYCIVQVGSQTRRTEIARDGGTSPVWNQTFQFNIINENDVQIEIKDHELGPDEVVGFANVNLARVRECGADRQNAPVFSRRTGAQHGFISLAMQWQPDYAGGYGGMQQPMYGGGMQQPMYGGGMQQPMYGGGMPQPMYGGGMQQPMYGGGMPQPMYDGGMQETVIVEEVYRPHHHHHHHHHHRREDVEVVVIEEQRW